jgi:hypothetical protein
LVISYSLGGDENALKIQELPVLRQGADPAPNYAINDTMARQVVMRLRSRPLIHGDTVACIVIRRSPRKNQSLARARPIYRRSYYALPE